MTQRVHVVINPGSGHNDPLLNILNLVFREAGWHWDISLTHEMGDATHCAQKALDSGVDVIAVYGGDGTVREVAGVLADRPVPLAILPGGTGNLTAIELNIPRNLRRAARLITGDHGLRRIDVGWANNEPFLVAAATGLIARVMDEADREIKMRLGSAAYYLVGLRELGRAERGQYHLKIDNTEIETEGVACLIANSGGVGIGGLSIPSSANLSDGKLHVVVFPRVDLPTVSSTVTEAVGLDQSVQALRRWTASEVTLTAAPAESITCDGDIIGETPVSITIQQQALNVIVPARSRPSEQRQQRQREREAAGKRPKAPDSRAARRHAARHDSK